MSIFALNLRFDLEQLPQDKSHRISNLPQISLNNTERTKCRAKEIDNIFSQQQTNFKQQQMRKEESLLAQILSEKDSDGNGMNEQGMSQQEKLYYRFLRTRRQKRKNHQYR